MNRVDSRDVLGADTGIRAEASVGVSCDQWIDVPFEIVVLYAEKLPRETGIATVGTPHFEAHSLQKWPAFVDGESELALLLTPQEREAAAAARAALLLRCTDGALSGSRVSAAIDRILDCDRHNAVAIVLPAARKVIGPSALASLASALSSSQGRLKLFVQFHVVRDDRYAWTHTHGMAHYGLPDLECRSPLERCDIARRMLEGAMAHLLQQGAGTLELGSVMDVIEPDGQCLGRFEVYPSREVEGHDYDAWGALQIVPIPTAETADGPSEKRRAATGSQLKLPVTKGQRVCDLDLQGAELTGLDLSGLNGERLDLSGANLRGAALRGVRLGSCRLQGALLEDTEWTDATMRICALDDARGAKARFDGARFEDSSAKGADLAGATLRGAKLTETSFERAILRGAIFDDAEGDGIQFRGADLSNASLIKVRFDEADFRGADLQGADLSHGRFRDADFRGAILDETRFDGVDCVGARFDDRAGPRSDSPSNADAKVSSSFDQLASAALRRGLSELPGVLAAKEGVAAQLVDGIRNAVDALGMADRPPVEWEAWLDSLAQGNDRVDLIDPMAVLEALRTEMTGNFAGGGPAAGVVTRLQHLAAALDANPDQPPEEWKALLEPLMNMIKDGQPLDLKVALDVLSSLARGQPSTAAQTSAPPTEDTGHVGNT